MTRFVVVNPFARKIEAVETETLIDAQTLAGLGNVDHGVLGRGPHFSIGYVVDEFGLFVPVSEQKYFGTCGVLIAGTAVFYGFDQAGETVSIRRSEFPDVTFYLGINDVEAAITREEVERPVIAVNGMVIWEWPNPAPADMARTQ
jgi:hypothetical protein